MLATILELLGLIVVVGTGTAYAGFRLMLKPFMVEFAEFGSVGYAVLCDILDGGSCDIERVADLKVRFEKIWTQAGKLIPFVKPILAQATALAVKK